MPLLLLAAWAYAPAQPISYHSPEVLLLEPYSGAAEARSVGLMLVRAILIVAAAICILGVGLRADQRKAQQWFMGVAAGLCLVSPVWVSIVLSGEWRGNVLPGLAAFALTCLLMLLVRKVSVIALSLGCILLLGGIYLSVQTAAAVMIRSNPPLQVLSWLAEEETTPERQLAGGLHFLSIGGVEEALPLLRAAGNSLSERYIHDAALYQAATRLADIPSEQGQ